ncbi:DUF4376 domain-containing protein [Escherichia coli]|uniref:DUF4376 domain-containing protein n=1 Tax=Escherichia coli TaxID=562 RepID=UPI00112035A6|nr:DUF4376 domain-containing protein [Escherichia coli]TPC96772.1 DUF4376 domain-containing protein [Escherichia coli]TPD41977.1 DUF4376 domain-containing protein [Escherichia coli]
MQIKRIENARYLENGAIDCEVLFDGMDAPVPYTATATDTAETGQRVWLELQSDRWGKITPFTVTPALIAAAKDAKKQEINAWRTEQEAQPFTVDWNDHTWNAGTESLARLYPVTLAPDTEARDVVVWGDSTNNPVPLTQAQLRELAAVMAQAQLERNNTIYQRQREMKEELAEMDDLKSIRLFTIGQ